MSSYCDFATGHPLHGPYHDQEYGFPADDETVLLGFDLAALPATDDERRVESDLLGGQ